LIVILVLVAAGAAWLRLGDRGTSRETVIAAIVREAQMAAPADVKVDTELRDILIEQGLDYLQLSNAKFDPARLSEGVTSAHGAFVAALRVDPSSRTAADGILRIVEAYEKEARAAYEGGDFARASELVRFGRAIRSDYLPLTELQADIARRAAATPR
jgi:hypothetical protein